MPLMVELFAGSGRMAQTFKESGFDTFTVDLEGSVDLEADILDIGVDDLPTNPTVVWASPPCQYYSYARGANSVFNPGGKPNLPEAFQANELVEHTLELIRDLDPTYWFLENPVGHLKSQAFMKKYRMTTVQYCLYGEGYQKPTNIWGQHPIHWTPKTHCYHQKHRLNISGNTTIPKRARALIPQLLCDEIVESVIQSKGAYIFEDLREWC